MLAFYIIFGVFFCAQWQVIHSSNTVPSIKYNVKLVAVAYHIIPAGFEHRLYRSFVSCHHEIFV